jgi:hypothetical protein
MYQLHRARLRRRSGSRPGIQGSARAGGRADPAGRKEKNSRQVPRGSKTIGEKSRWLRVLGPTWNTWPTTARAWGTWVLATCGAEEREPHSRIFGGSGAEENVTGQQRPGFQGVASSPPATQNQRKAAHGRFERHLANNGQGPVVRPCYQSKNSAVQMPRAARGRSMETPDQRLPGSGDSSVPPTKVIRCTCRKTGSERRQPNLLRAVTIHDYKLLEPSICQ